MRNEWGMTEAEDAKAKGLYEAMMLADDKTNKSRREGGGWGDASLSGWSKRRANSLRKFLAQFGIEGYKVVNWNEYASGVDNSKVIEIFTGRE